MIITNKGKTGQLYTVAVGTLGQDARYAEIGERKTSKTDFSLALTSGNRDDTATQWLSCECWYKLARYARGLEKGDTVLVAGQLEIDPYWTKRNNRETYKMRVEFVSIQSYGEELDKPRAANEAPDEDAPRHRVKCEGDDSDDFRVVENDEDLPF